MRRLLLSLTLALTLSAVGAGSALAEAPEGAQKAPLFGPNPQGDCETGAGATPKTFGFAVLNTPGNEMTLSGEVALKRATRETTYRVVAEQVIFARECAETEVGNITTNKEGNGDLHFSTERIPLATRFWVAIRREVTNTYASPAIELD
jgi:hypothetical protein